MSHATGAVRFLNGDIFFYEYNGTVDICQPILFKTYEELHENWRTKEWRQCSCKDDEIIKNHERVRIASTYGYGFSWDGFACKKCMCLLSPLEVNYDTETNGLPEWFPNKDAYNR